MKRVRCRIPHQCAVRQVRVLQEPDEPAINDERSLASQALRAIRPPNVLWSHVAALQ
jgi:hypothetical protein